MGATLQWIFPAISVILSGVYAAHLARRWLARRRAHQAAWAAGLLWYAIASGAELLGNAFGWSDPLYRLWYLFGAILLAAYLGLGEVFLLRGTRFGYLAALGVLLGSIPALASAPSQPGALAIGTAGLVASAALSFVQRYRPEYVGLVTLGLLAVGTLYGVVAVSTAPVDHRYMFDPVTGTIQGRGFPAEVRLLTPMFNIAGASVLVFGAAYSGWQYRWRGLQPGRAQGCTLIALGGFIPSVTSSLARLGLTSAFHLGEMLGILCIVAGSMLVERATEPLEKASAVPASLQQYA